MKTKITVEQVLPNGETYRVLSLVNRTTPRVGTSLTAEEIDTLLAEDEDQELTVTVRKAR